MLRIGICDDVRREAERLKNVCETYLKNKHIAYKCISFLSGEELFDYLSSKTCERIDLLFLDIEMPGMDGVEIKDSLRSSQMVWRIVFVSSHMEYVLDTFGVKTVGFVHKPYKSEDVTKWLDMIQLELEENLPIIFSGLEKVVYLDEICYLRGDGNYTEIHFANNRGMRVVSMQLGKIEKELEGLSVARSHKSFMVNLRYVYDKNSRWAWTDYDDKIPIGRSYKDKFDEKYHAYILGTARRRI